MLLELLGVSFQLLRESVPVGPNCANKMLQDDSMLQKIWGVGGVKVVSCDNISLLVPFVSQARDYCA